jgi:hypothetical protein
MVYTYFYKGFHMFPMKRTLLIFTLLIAAGLVFFLRSPSIIRPVRIRIELSEKAPLSALARIEAREPFRVELVVHGLDDNDLIIAFDALSARQDIPVLGLYPDHVNQVEFRLKGKSGRTFLQTEKIVTKPLPSIFPEIQFERHFPDLIAPGMIFLHLGHYDESGDFYPLPCAVDNYGRVRWFYDGSIGHVLERLENGKLLIHEDDTLVEIDMLGKPSGRRWKLDTGIHHDALELPDGRLLVLSSSPGSFDDGMVEVDRESGRHLRYWDFRDILDEFRPRQPRNLEEADWLHLNGLDYDPRNDSVILSGRDQSAVVRIGRKSGELEWILGNHDFWKDRFSPFLLEPQGDPFEWAWGQHAPMVHPENSNRILIYDNGNKRSYDDPLEPEDNYSRAVEYEVDTDTMQVRQIWEYGREYGSELYTPFIGDANYLPGGNRLVCFGGISRNLQGEAMEIFDFENETINNMKISAIITEVTGELPAREVMSIRLEDPDPKSYRGYRSYRAVKMSLYPE